MQEELPAAEYRPLGQVAQEEAPLAEYLPAAHCEQEVALPPPPAVPELQEKQAPDER